MNMDSLRVSLSELDDMMELNLKNMLAAMALLQDMKEVKVQRARYPMMMQLKSMFNPDTFVPIGWIRSHWVSLVR